MQAMLFDLPHHPPDDPDVRFTLPATLAWCMAKAGVTAWDLDVAACEEAHCAPMYYTHADNGLARPWNGRVWCNPPWSHIRPWVERAWQEFLAGRSSVIGMLLPGDRQEQSWWQDLVEPERDGRGGLLSTHYTRGRHRYGKPGDPLGLRAKEPNFNTVFLCWRAR